MPVHKHEWSCDMSLKSTVGKLSKNLEHRKGFRVAFMDCMPTEAVGYFNDTFQAFYNII